MMTRATKILLLLQAAAALAAWYDVCCADDASESYRAERDAARLRETGIAAAVTETRRQIELSARALERKTPAIVAQRKRATKVAPALAPVLTASAHVEQGPVTADVSIEELRDGDLVALLGEVVVTQDGREILRQPFDHRVEVHAAPLVAPLRAPGWGLGVTASIDSDLTPRVGGLVLTPGACAWRLCARGLASVSARRGTLDRVQLTAGVVVDIR
jgi:hypothetical protein